MDVDTVRTKYAALERALNERSRRLWAAEARALGHGGIAVVGRATGISRSTIQRGLRELEEPEEMLEPERVSRSGGGRNRIVEKDPTVLSDLDGLVEPTASGAPDVPLRWTSNSVRKLSDELKAMGHELSYPVVADFLHGSGDSLKRAPTLLISTIRN